MKRIILPTLCCLLLQTPQAQDCVSNADVDAVAGKYLTADQYPWPAVRAEYFKGMSAAADKAMAKQTLLQIEKIEQQSHQGFNLTGGNWENTFSTDGYVYFGNNRLGRSTFQSSLFEYFCYKGKLTRNTEANTILRIYSNSVALNSMDRFLHLPFGSTIGPYDWGLQYADWKNHKPADVDAQLIALFAFIGCNTPPLIEAINTGNTYWQDTPDKDIKPNNRNKYIYRYWFIKKDNQRVLVPVSRKEYLQGLLEYYEREKLYFPKLIAKLTSDHDNGIKQYNGWEADIAGKIDVVKKVLAGQSEDWLKAQAVINRLEDASLNYKSNYAERTNYNRFWKFYDGEKKSEALYQYNPEYFKATAASLAKPKVITIAFRYVTDPASLRILNNFTKNFKFGNLKKIVE